MRVKLFADAAFIKMPIREAPYRSAAGLFNACTNMFGRKANAGVWNFLLSTRRYVHVAPAQGGAAPVGREAPTDAQSTGDARLRDDLQDEGGVPGLALVLFGTGRSVCFVREHPQFLILNGQSSLYNSSGRPLLGAATVRLERIQPLLISKDESLVGTWRRTAR